MEFSTIFLYFFIYSILGWTCEMIYCSICDRKIVNRGFLFGPYCPIYGFGGLIITFFLSDYYYNPLIIFLFGMIATSILEYITSYMMEKIFNAKWWDYSKHKFNLNGRICLLNSTEFGILCLAVTYIFEPFANNIINFIPNTYKHLVISTIIIFMFIDFTITIATIFSLREKLITFAKLANSINEKNNEKLQDLEILKQLQIIRQNIIDKRNIFKKRIIEAFPNLDFEKINKQFLDIKLQLSEKRKNYKERKK